MNFISVSTITPREVVKGFTGRFIHTEHMTIAYWDVKAGSEIPLHEHTHEMMVNVLEGMLELTIGTEVKVIQYGEVGVIPSHVPHKAKAITDCRILDVFSPVREDYK